MAFSEEFLEELSQRNDIVDVVGSYVHLTKRSGANQFGLCPFHNEKTPSFSVNGERQIYHCFGCGKGGGVISFIMEIENLSFPDAVQFLARRAGTEVPEEAPDPSRNRRERMLALNREAARFFYDQLRAPTGAAGQAYVRQRGIVKMVKPFGLGFAPDSWQSLTDAMKARGFTNRELVDAGLSRVGKNGGLYDYFRNRLMFPVIDDGKHEPVAEVVVEPAVLPYPGKPCVHQLPVGEAPGLHGVGEALPAVRGEAQAEGLDHLHDAPLAHIGLAGGAGGGPELIVEKPRRLPVQGQHPLPPVSAGIRRLLRHLRPRPPGQELHRVREGQVLDLHDEADDPAALAAAEAVVYLPLAVDGEGGGLFVVEGAKAELVRPAALRQVYIGADHVHDVVALAQFLQKFLGKGHGQSPPFLPDGRRGRPCTGYYFTDQLAGMNRFSKV